MNFIRALLFFPSINFGLMRAEIFPWATVYSLLVIRRLNTRFFAILLLFLLSVSVASIGTNFLFLGEHIRALAAYCNPLLVFFAILSVSESEIYRLRKLITPLLIFLILLGVIQLTGLISSLDSLFSFLIPRGASDSLSNIGRGVTLLSTEPSRAGYEILFLYAAWRHFSAKSIRLLLLSDMLFFLYILMVIQSGLAAYLAIVYFFAVYLKYYTSLVFFTMLIGTLVLFVDTRATSLITDLFSLRSVGEVYSYLIDASGFRLVSVVSAYSYGVSTLFGGGIGLWQMSSIAAMEAAGFSATDINYFVFHANGEFSAIRPTSYAANLALDTGLIGLVFVVTLLFKYIREALRHKRRDNNAFVFLFIFSFFFIGAVGNPIPWIILALLVRQSQCDVEFTTEIKNRKNSTFVNIAKVGEQL